MSEGWPLVDFFVVGRLTTTTLKDFSGNNIDIIHALTTDL